MDKMYSASTLGNQAQQYGQANEVSGTGLAALADRLSEGVGRIVTVTGYINQISLGIHGPRPTEAGGSSTPNKPVDSLRSRIDDMLSEIGRLEVAVQALAR